MPSFNILNGYLKAVFLSLFLCFINLELLVGKRLTHVQKVGPNQPFIEEIWIGGVKHNVDSLLSIKATISLPFDKNSLIVQFTNNADAGSIQYAYFLDGFDSTWVYSGNQRQAFYANLNPGNYTFNLKSSADGLNWNTSNTTLMVEVITPFWSYWWFPIIAMIFVLLLLFLIYKLRVNEAISNVLELEKRRKEETEAMRVSMARDFHDEMGNKLASIIVLASTLQLLIKSKTDEINSALIRIESDSKSLFSGTKTFIWSIDPKSDSLYEIFNYIIHFGSDLFENTQVDFIVENQVDEALKKAIMRIGVSRQIFFIFKEAMTNGLVHSGATEIRLSFHVDPTSSTFTATLTDNGLGLDEAFLESPRGLTNMRTRAKKIDCRLAFINNPKGGLNVTLTGVISNSNGL